MMTQIEKDVLTDDQPQEISSRMAAIMEARFASGYELVSSQVCCDKYHFYAFMFWRRK